MALLHWNGFDYLPASPDLPPLRSLLERGSWTENDSRVDVRPASFMLTPTSPVALTGRN